MPIGRGKGRPRKGCKCRVVHSRLRQCIQCLAYDLQVTTVHDKEQLGEKTKGEGIITVDKNGRMKTP